MNVASDYVLVVQAPAFPLHGGEFATESAFARHLIELRQALGSSVSRLVLIAPQMSAETYGRAQNSLERVSEESHGISFVPAYPQTAGRLEFLRQHLIPMVARIRRVIATAAVVHSGLSDDLWRPMMALANYTAKFQGRPVIFIVDIDFRKDSHRYRRMGMWSFRSYLLNRLVYDPFKWLQVWLAVRHFQLVLLKSQSMVDDFGAGRPNVRNFFDVVHSSEQVVGDDQIMLRSQRQSDRTQPLRAAYFGRLVDYKGVNLAIDAVHLARKRGADVRFRIVGQGESEGRLRDQVRRLGLEDHVSFEPLVPYGPALFALMDACDVTIATPIAEDTPRGAFDSMARGLPVIAFDINYYKDLAAHGGGVALATWPEPASIADRLCELAADRSQLATLSRRGVSFALSNTHDYWISLRTEWAREFLVRAPTPSDAASGTAATRYGRD